MADARLWMEAVKGQSPTSGTCNIRGAGKTQSRWYIGQAGDSTRTPVTTLNEFYKAKLELLGTTYPHSDGVRLRRLLPKADPFIQYYYCEEIKWQGQGRPTTSAATPLGQLEAPSFDNVTIYPTYAFDCTFSPRPYAIIQDGTIPSGTKTWYGDGGATTAQNYGAFDYAEEWLRYTDIEVLPGGEFITAQGGQFLVDVASGQKPNSVSAIQGQVRLFVKKSGLRLTWYQIPYSYVDPSLSPTRSNSLGSYIMAALGHINQYDWWNYPKGTLLLEAVGVSRYSPVVPNPIPWAGSTQIISNAKLCDITFIFSNFNPTNNVVGQSPLSYGLDALGANAVPSATATLNPNVIPAGHNLVPVAHMMSWYYAKTFFSGLPDCSNRPIYPSFPYQLLFSNPGVTA